MPVTGEMKDKTASLTEVLELRLAAKQGYVRSQFILAVKLASGDGIPKDLEEAVKWYQKAAKQGFAPAQNNLGHIFAGKHYSSPNPAEAVRWFRRNVQHLYDCKLQIFSSVFSVFSGIFPCQPKYNTKMWDYKLG